MPATISLPPFRKNISGSIFQLSSLMNPVGSRSKSRRPEAGSQAVQVRSCPSARANSVRPSGDQTRPDGFEGASGGSCSVPVLASIWERARPWRTSTVAPSGETSHSIIREAWIVRKVAFQVSLPVAAS